MICVFNCDVDLKLYILTLSMVSPFIICAVVPVSNFFSSSNSTCSVSVFGVSPTSLQCSYDQRGNSVPTILLMMQRKLYIRDGLKV